MKQVTRVYSWFYGVPKGKRKEYREYYLLGESDGHNLLSPDDFNHFERKFWKLIDESDYKVKPNKAKIAVNWGQLDGEIVMVQLLAKQNQLIMR